MDTRQSLGLLPTPSASHEHKPSKLDAPRAGNLSLNRFKSAPYGRNVDKSPLQQVNTTPGSTQVQERAIVMASRA